MPLACSLSRSHRASPSMTSIGDGPARCDSGRASLIEVPVILRTLYPPPSRCHAEVSNRPDPTLRRYGLHRRKTGKLNRETFYARKLSIPSSLDFPIAFALAKSGPYLGQPAAPQSATEIEMRSVIQIAVGCRADARGASDQRDRALRRRHDSFRVRQQLAELPTQSSHGFLRIRFQEETAMRL